MPLTSEQRQMVEGNIILAQKIAKKLSRRLPLDNDECLSVCYLALVKAAMAFKPSKGEFDKYASTFMFYEIRRAAYPTKPKLETKHLKDLLPLSRWQDIRTYEFEDEVVCQVTQEQLFKQISSMFKGKSKDIFCAHYANPEASQAELGRIAGCCYQNVGHVMNRLERLSKELMVI